MTNQSNRCANQSVIPSTPLKLRSGLILEATHREPERSVVVAHVGSAAAEGEVVGEGAINRTAPIDADGTHIEERTIAGVAVASQGQFQRGSKGTGAVITAPACAFGI